MDQSIFGLRFRSNEDIQPSPEELKSFLESSKKEGGRERHRDDMAKYLQHLQRVEEFEMKQKQGMGPLDFNEKMVFGVLSHSHFFKPSLKLAIEQYKYHRHKLSLIDFKKPQAFIKSAEEEISKLNPKKKEDQLKIARFQSMIDQRNKDVEALNMSWRELSAELHNIAVYIWDNLIKIQKLCESSIALLVNLQIEGEKTSQLIEDVKTHFKDQVRDQLQLGPVTKQYIETLKEDVAKLSKQLSQVVLEDIYSLARVYEAVHDHAKKIAARLDELIRQIDPRQRKDLDADRKLFGQVEQALISLVSEFHFEVEKSAEPGAAMEHEKLLFDKRKEMLNHLFDLLERGLN